MADLLAVLPFAVFWIFALMTAAGAFAVALSRSLIYCAFGLLSTFFGVAGLYIFLEADFLAAIQLLIYVGGILVLLLFGIMLTRRSDELSLQEETIQFPAAAVLAAALFSVVAYVMTHATWHQPSGTSGTSSSLEIGRRLLSTRLLPFEVSSVLLLIALAGAATIVRRRRTEGGGDD